MTGRTFFGASVMALVALVPAIGRGNGAFPDTSAILLPAARPATIILGTTFGLVTTTDGGATWRWACEHDDSVNGSAYQLGTGPDLRVFTLGSNGLAFTDDLGCTWRTAPGQDETLAYDYFPDPGDARRVLVVAVVLTTTGVSSVVLASNDGGASFGPPFYRAPEGFNVSTVEVAQSDPRVVYITVTKSDGTQHTRIIRSDDRGRSWGLRDPGEVHGHADLLIAGVAPEDPERLYLRVVGGSFDGLALSEDGGASARLVLEAPGTLQAFIRLADGSLLASAVDSDNKPHIFRSRDRGRSYAALAAPVRARAFGERGGRVYAASDNLRDGAAIHVSDDGGDSWQPLMRLADVSDTLSCPGLRAVCAPQCATIAVTESFHDSLCQQLAAAPAEPPVEPSADAGAAVSPPGGGCACAVGARPRAGGAWIGLVALGLAFGRRRRRRAKEQA